MLIPFLSLPPGQTPKQPKENNAREHHLESIHLSTPSFLVSYILFLNSCFNLHNRLLDDIKRNRILYLNFPVQSKGRRYYIFMGVGKFWKFGDGCLNLWLSGFCLLDTLFNFTYLILCGPGKLISSYCALPEVGSKSL